LSGLLAKWLETQRDAAAIASDWQSRWGLLFSKDPGTPNARIASARDAIQSVCRSTRSRGDRDCWLVLHELDLLPAISSDRIAALDRWMELASIHPGESTLRVAFKDLRRGVSELRPSLVA